jgi:hypothetical protein
MSLTILALETKACHVVGTSASGSPRTRLPWLALLRLPPSACSPDVAVWAQARIDMCVFDEDGDGYLKHTELEAYIGQLIPRWPPHTHPPLCCPRTCPLLGCWLLIHASPLSGVALPECWICLSAPHVSACIPGPRAPRLHGGTGAPAGPHLAGLLLLPPCAPRHLSPPPLSIVLTAFRIMLWCSLPQLASSDLAPGGAFVNMYKKISARKFFFFIDLHKRNKLLIRYPPCAAPALPNSGSCHRRKLAGWSVKALAQSLLGPYWPLPPGPLGHAGMAGTPVPLVLMSWQPPPAPSA